MNSLVNLQKLNTPSSWFFKVLASTFLLVIFFIWPKISLAQQVMINEILSDPTGTDTGLEWIELFNPGSQAIDLTGWQLNAVSGKYYTLPSFALAAGSFALIHWRADGQNSASELFTGSQTITENMGNKSGFVALFKNSEHNKDTIVDYLEYGEGGKTWESTAVSAGIWQAGQFIGAPSEGQSAGLKQDGQDKNLVSDWQIFTGPTPNQSNAASVASPNETTTQSAPPNQQSSSPESTQTQATSTTEAAFSNYSDKILINEFMPWPDSGNEWVELINLDTQTIDLSNWQIDDEPEESSPQKVPDGTTIESNQFLVIELNKNAFNNDGDQVRLIWPDGQIVHTVSYPKALQGSSSARFENGLWLWTDQPTPNQKNKKSVVEQTKPEQTNEFYQTEIITLVETTTENSPQSESAKEQSKTTNQKIDNPPTISQPPSQNLGPAAIGALSQKQIPTKKSSTSLFLTIGTITLLSVLTGMSLVYFRRKKTIDNQQKPF